MPLGGIDKIRNHLVANLIYARVTDSYIKILAAIFYPWDFPAFPRRLFYALLRKQTYFVEIQIKFRSDRSMKKARTILRFYILFSIRDTIVKRVRAKWDKQARYFRDRTVLNTQRCVKNGTEMYSKCKRTDLIKDICERSENIENTDLF